MFGNSGFVFIASAIKKHLFSINTQLRTELNTIDKLRENLYISWVADNTDIPDCTVCYELYNGEPTQLNADKGEKGFRITIIRNDVVRGRAEITYADKPNVPGVGLDISITGPTDIEYMHEWRETMNTYIPTYLDKLKDIPDSAFIVGYE